MKVTYKDLIFAGLASALVYSLGIILIPDECPKVLAQITTTAPQAVENTTPLNPGLQEIPKKDIRVETLETFLESKHSPLAPHAHTFVKAADVTGLDYRILPAISGIESGFGKALLPNSYNPFGWGGGYLYFRDFNEAIFTVAFGLKQDYVEKGAQTIDEIAPIYCPPNAVKWAGNVKSIINQVEKTTPSR